MSLQTGREVPEAARSKSFIDRLRHLLTLFIHDPNPIWIRELKQSTRLTRTPIILMIVSMLTTLVIASLGGTMSDRQPADKVGVALFHTYFSIAFFVVTLVGPALAANTVASEREGKTWDAVVLTGLLPEQVARGKFLAAYTAISTYIVMLAPVGALSFLFGGVTASEVAIAFVALFLIAAVFVALGLAISAKLQTLRASIVVTLLLAVPFAALLYVAFGLGAAEAIHSLWPRVPAKLPVWLPSAYIRGDFGVYYVLLLIVMPLVALIVSLWFCYACTVANLRDENDDRGFGLKKWYLGSVPIMLGTAMFAELTATKGQAEPVAAMAAVTTALFLGFGLLVFVAEPVAPSRRVRAALLRDDVGRARLLLAPSVATTGYIQIIVGVVALFVVGWIGTVQIHDAGIATRRGAEGFQYFVGYQAAFFVFAVGFSVWLRARSSSAAVARVLILVTIACACIVPWVLGAILGVLARDEAGLLVASPSPFYSIVMFEAANDASQEDKVVAGMVCIVLWASLGLVALFAGSARSRAIRAEREKAAASSEELAVSDARDTAASAA